MKLKAQSINGKVKLTWSGLAGVDSYRIKRAQLNGYSENLVELRAGYYIDEKVRLGLSYSYTVVAVFRNSEFKSSNEVTVKVS